MAAALEAVAVAVHLDDVHVVGEAVQQCPGEPFRSEDLCPLVEGQVGGDQNGTRLVALTEDLEEQFRPGGGQRHEVQFVDDEEPEASQVALEVEQSAVVSGLHEFVDQGRGGGGGEAHGHSPLTGGQSHAQGYVGFVGAAVADGDDVFTVLYVFTPGQLHDQGVPRQSFLPVHLLGLPSLLGSVGPVAGGRQTPR